MRKNPHGRILKGEPKEQYLSNIPKSCQKRKKRKKKSKNSTSEHLEQFSKRKCVFISRIHSLIFFIYFLGCGRLINI